MSGLQFYDALKKRIQRRAFLVKLGLISTTLLLDSCYKKVKGKKYNIPCTLHGPDAQAGHILRDKKSLPTPTTSSKVQYLIIGSGISGLSAGRWLLKNGIKDFRIAELEQHPGGNSHSGKNKVSAYPFAAHYITIPDHEDKLLCEFLEEAGVITHYENELPYLNEYYLTFAPEERLLIKGHWQEGIIPEFGISDEEKRQIKNFFQLISELKFEKGTDGKYAFCTPIHHSSQDSKYLELDKISFAAYLNKNGFNAHALLWYLNYACKDDYGQTIENVSAWAGLHYFASRRGKAANAENGDVLTWPEGNAMLMKSMFNSLSDYTDLHLMCYKIDTNRNDLLQAYFYDSKTKETSIIEAEKIIVCTPQFVRNRLLPDSYFEEKILQNFQYTPWVVANISIKKFPKSNGTTLCWDNVAFDTPSVGYVNATHQHLSTHQSKKVITYYLPLCKDDNRIERIAAYSRTKEQWLDIILPELEFMHPNITEQIEAIDIWVWGHGMITPSVNFIHSDTIKNAGKPFQNRVFFAHSDLSGISIFEEAFHQGIIAAKQMLKNE